MAVLWIVHVWELKHGRLIEWGEEKQCIGNFEMSCTINLSYMYHMMGKKIDLEIGSESWTKYKSWTQHHENKLCKCSSLQLRFVSFNA